MVVFNFERALVRFSPHRLVTEGVITLNAIICTVLVAIGTQVVPKQIGNQFLFAEWLWKVPIWGFVVMVGTTFAFWESSMRFMKTNMPQAHHYISVLVRILTLLRRNRKQGAQGYLVLGFLSILSEKSRFGDRSYSGKS